MFSVASDRVAGIDILRGLSIIAVILLHLNIRIPLSLALPHLPRFLAWPLLWSGFYGVTSFFVISGYLITQKSYERWGTLSQITLSSFYCLRFARIIPGLLVLLMLLSLLDLLHVPGFVLDPQQATLSRAWWEALSFHVNMFQARWGDLPASWNALWSLSIEEAFYIGFPLLCVALKTEKRIALLLLVFVAIAPFARVFGIHETDAQDQTYLCCLDGLALGCLAAIWRQHLRLSPSAQRLCFILGLCLFALIDVLRVQTSRWGLVSSGTYVTILITGVALMLIALDSGLRSTRKLPGADLVAQYGRHSYEIYLTHTFVTVAALGIYHWAGEGAILVPLFYILVLSLSLLLGLGYARVITAPANTSLRKTLPISRA